jgi:outer membrane receptor for ferrienterochelin and colicins
MNRNAVAVLLPVLFFLHVAAHSQMLTGTVVDGEWNALHGAGVYWLHAPERGATTDEAGQFVLSMPPEGTPTVVIATYVGFRPDTLDLKFFSNIFIQLTATESLETVEVKARQEGSYFADAPAKLEVITSRELTRAACCDLSGCFETQGSVQAVTTNVLTNAKELRILGLSGVYNQVLFDGLPLVQGLSYAYGVSSYPGPLIGNIFVAKGANSVLQGFESISGQINVLPKNPGETDKLLANAYANSFGETQLNAVNAIKGKKWANLLAIHTAQPGGRFDRDGDSFLDVPLVERYAIYNKIMYGDETQPGWHSAVGLRFWREDRLGGQVDFREKDRGDDAVYGQFIQIRQPEIYTRTGYRFDKTHKITLLASAFFHDQDAHYGVTGYRARQESVYANAQYELRWREKHDLKAGFSFRRLTIDEDISFSENSLGRTFDGNYLRQESISGIFAENVFRGERFTVVAGARLDHHNEFGWFATPRGLLRYDFSDRTIMRISAGTGFRTANIFSEHPGLLAGSREVVFSEALRPEKAFNYGVNFNHSIFLENTSIVLSGDFYCTRFTNQIFPDYDSQAGVAIIENFTGKSASNGLQLEGKAVFHQQMELKLVYGFLDVYRKYGEQKVELPFNPRHKILAAFSYEPKNRSWRADANAHWFGRQQLPDTRAYPEEFRQPDESNPYSQINLQFTKVWSAWEVYAGCENIFDFRQRRPMLSWQDPFGPYFDTAFNWGPTRGREFYVGVRFRVD